MLSANEVASVIIARQGTWIDAMGLQKLLYYAQAWHLAVTDEPLFGEKVKAWRDGPVVPQVWHDRKDQATRRSAAQSLESVELDELSSDLIDLVLAAYGSMSGEELGALTHVEKPWQEARGDVPDGEDCREAISQKSMAAYYRAHRRLGGRTAADLAAGGVHVGSLANGEPEALDIDAFLDSLGPEFNEPGTNPYGSANLAVAAGSGADGIEETAKRTYAGA